MSFSINIIEESYVFDAFTMALFIYNELVFI